MGLVAYEWRCEIDWSRVVQEASYYVAPTQVLLGYNWLERNPGNVKSREGHIRVVSPEPNSLLPPEYTVASLY